MSVLNQTRFLSPSWSHSPSISSTPSLCLCSWCRCTSSLTSTPAESKASWAWPCLLLFTWHGKFLLLCPFCLSELPQAFTFLLMIFYARPGRLSYSVTEPLCWENAAKTLLFLHVVTQQLAGKNLKLDCETLTVPYHLISKTVYLKDVCCFVMLRVLWVHHVSGIWVYPIMSHLSPMGLVVFLGVASVSIAPLYLLGEKMNQLMWRTTGGSGGKGGFGRASCLLLFLIFQFSSIFSEVIFDVMCEYPAMVIGRKHSCLSHWLSKHVHNVVL